MVCWRTWAEAVIAGRLLLMALHPCGQATCIRTALGWTLSITIAGLTVSLSAASKHLPCRQTHSLSMIKKTCRDVYVQKSYRPGVPADLIKMVFGRVVRKFSNPLTTESITLLVLQWGCIDVCSTFSASVDIPISVIARLSPPRGSVTVRTVD